MNNMPFCFFRDSQMMPATVLIKVRGNKYSVLCVLELFAQFIFYVRCVFLIACWSLEFSLAIAEGFMLSEAFKDGCIVSAIKC